MLNGVFAQVRNNIMVCILATLAITAGCAWMLSRTGAASYWGDFAALAGAIAGMLIMVKGEEGAAGPAE